MAPKKQNQNTTVSIATVKKNLLYLKQRWLWKTIVVSKIADSSPLQHITQAYQTWLGEVKQK